MNVNINHHHALILNLKGNAGSGQFLQVSGLKVIFDVRRPPGDRLVQVLFIVFLRKEGLCQLGLIMRNVKNDKPDHPFVGR